jgi:hypothetical protein
MPAMERKVVRTTTIHGIVAQTLMQMVTQTAVLWSTFVRSR